MIIGITGGLGTGKTTVAKMFAVKGAKVLDADRFSHMALRKGSYTYKMIVSYFGRDVLNKDKSVSKRKLANIVFSDRDKLRKLTSIIHPFVIKKIRDSIRQVNSKNIIIIDAPLLVEAGLASIVDKLLVVKATWRTQLQRCVKKRGFRKKEVIARIKRQMPLNKKIAMADYVIDNSSTLKQTKRQVDKIWKKVKYGGE